MEAATSINKSAGGRAVDSSDAEITINLAPYKTYTELASNVSLTLTLNELQQMVLLQVAKFMDKKRDAAVRTTNRSPFDELNSLSMFRANGQEYAQNFPWKVPANNCGNHTNLSWGTRNLSRVGP